MEDIPNYGPVHGEAVYLLTKGTALRIPPPPTMRNHGNYVVSISELGRFLAEQAEAGGVALLPETSAERLLVEHGRVVGVRTGDKGRGRNGEQLGAFEPGSDIVARVTVLAEGTAGHLTMAAIDHFGLQGQNPQIWALGVKEVWRVPRPLHKVIHTLGWPLRKGRKHREFGGSFVYPMGEDMVSLGFVVGLEYRDVELSAHDLLQEFKTHRLIRRILEGGERIAWGAKTITEGGFLSLPSRLNVPGLLLVGEGARPRQRAAPEGHPLRVESGRLAAEAIFRSLQRGESPSRLGALDAYDESLRESYVWKELREVRNMRQVFDKGFYVGGALASAMTVSKGSFPPKDYDTEPNAASPSCSAPGVRGSTRRPTGRYIFDKLSSVFASGNRTRDDQPSHIRVRTHVPRDLAEAWAGCARRTCTRSARPAATAR